MNEGCLNHGIKARIYNSKVIEIELDLRFLKNA